MEGVLFKRSKGKGFLAKSQWIDRYYVLNKDTKELNCYQESKGKRSYRGQVSIETARLVECLDSDKPHSFELVAKNSSDVNEVMILAAPSDEEMRKWITAICEIAPCTADWITPLPSIVSENILPTTSLSQKITTEPQQREVPSVSPGDEYELNQIDEDDEIDLLPMPLPMPMPIPEDQIVDVPSVGIDVSPNPPEEVQQEIVQTEGSPSEDSNQTVRDVRGEAPFLRGSSGYDFGKKVEKFFHSPEPIAEEETVDILRSHSHSNQQEISEEFIDTPQSNDRMNSSSSWVFTCLCKEMLPSIGTRLARRCQLYSYLFPGRSSNDHDSSMASHDSSTLFDFQVVKELLGTTSIESSQSQISLSYPYLPSTGCNWCHILKYLRYVERNQFNDTKYLIEDYLEDEDDILMTLECSLSNANTSQTHVFDVNTRLNYNSWIDDVIQKIQSLNLEGLHDNEEILEIIHKSYSQILSSLFRKQRKDLFVAENYLLSQEFILVPLEDESQAKREKEFVDEEFEEADLDGDGTINRAEWRRWMLEKEEIIRKGNHEKSQLIQENQNLRKALTSTSSQIFHDLQAHDEKIQQLEADLTNANTEIDKLKMELKLCYQQFHEADLLGKSLPFSSSLTSIVKSEEENRTMNSVVNNHKDDDDREDEDLALLRDLDSSSSCESDTEEEEEDVVDSIDKYLQKRTVQSQRKDQQSSVIEVDLTHINQSKTAIRIRQEERPLRRNSLDIVKSRPLQMRTTSKSFTPPPVPTSSVVVPTPERAPAQEIRNKISKIFPSTEEGSQFQEDSQRLSPQNILEPYPVIVMTPKSHLSLSPRSDADDMLQGVSSDHSLGDYSSSSLAHSHSLPMEPSYQSHETLPTATGAAAEWVHDYISTLREKHHSSPGPHSRSRDLSRSESSPMRLQASHPHLSSSLSYLVSLQNLPPAINETIQSHYSLERDVYGSPTVTAPPGRGSSPSASYYSSPLMSSLKSKKSLCRDDTLITGREHGVFTSRNMSRDGDSQPDDLMVTAQGGTEKKKLHPLQRALKNHSSQLAHPISSYSPKISKLTSSSSPPSLNCSKSFSRESQRNLPASQRYLVGVTTASACKTKKSISAPMGAVRGTQEWK